ncbi:uncharacterized protein F4812DRAFT_202762 [Daldinia caldariorum]|uniref:uncharacterized protein n=1 Tax=Daldinia caldariorum TaxID=326644 RepID=UPI0020073F5D|nr:uncharacterized protein F4812DRAFT_202762 [Daldinia caldariorum]KAI1472031.1 hypothetical protein F4812DRAFT_202762 [Daldinia caldariorum]
MTSRNDVTIGKCRVFERSPPTTTASPPTSYSISLIIGLAPVGHASLRIDSSYLGSSQVNLKRHYLHGSESLNMLKDENLQVPCHIFFSFFFITGLRGYGSGYLIDLGGKENCRNRISDDFYFFSIQPYTYFLMVFVFFVCIIFVFCR